jgi:xanthine dehydrogenase accessory factor
VTYTGATPDEDLRAAFGLPHDASATVLLERAGVTGTIDALEVGARCRQLQRRGAVATVLRSELPELRTGARLARIAGCALEQERDAFDPHLRELVAADLRAGGESGCRRYDTPFGAVDVFVEVILPPPQLFLFGTGHDAVPVTQLARVLGWDVVVCTDSERRAARERFASADELVLGSLDAAVARVGAAERAVAIVSNQDLARDRACVAALLATPVRYIAVLGSPALLGEVIDPRVRAPRGAGMSEEIAFALVADAFAALGRVTQVPVSGGGSAATIAAAPAR